MIQILLVEDNEGDIVLTMEALQEAKLLNKVHVVRDGVEAIDYLDQKLIKNKEELPDLILLDINLPRIDGKEVLQYIKKHNQLKTISVVMLTTSSSELDILDAYNNHANSFITKPVDLNKLFDVVKVIEHLWVSIVKLPSKN
jgi:CheY-like chemotaxis protein